MGPRGPTGDRGFESAAQIWATGSAPPRAAFGAEQNTAKRPQMFILFFFYCSPMAFPRPNHLATMRHVPPLPGRGKGGGWRHNKTSEQCVSTLSHSLQSIQQLCRHPRANFDKGWARTRDAQLRTQGSCPFRTSSPPESLKKGGGGGGGRGDYKPLLFQGFPKLNRLGVVNKES